MAIILGLNKDVVERIVKELGLQTMVDIIPRKQLEGRIRAVFVSNPDEIATSVRSVWTQEELFDPPIE